DLDVDEALVHDGGRRVVLERLVRHHVATVAGAVPPGDEERRGGGRARGARQVERLVAPRVPVHGFLGVLQQVGARLSRQTVHAKTVRTPRSSVRRRPRATREASEQSSGRAGGAGARLTGRPDASSASSARETASAPATWSTPDTSSP